MGKLRTSLAIGLVALLPSCYTPRPGRVHMVDSFILCVEEGDRISQIYQKATGRQEDVLGFCQQNTRIIYVQYSSNKDNDGEYLPDFKILGHEVYHLIKPDFHRHGERQ